MIKFVNCFLLTVTTIFLCNCSDTPCSKDLENEILQLTSVVAAAKTKVAMQQAATQCKEMHAKFRKEDGCKIDKATWYATKAQQDCNLMESHANTLP